MIDIVFPNNNEEEFKQLAKRLNIDKLLFAKKKGKFFKADNLTIYRADDKIRSVIENNKNINLVFGAETIQEKDFIHQRGSGLNHIICTLMKKKNIKYAFAFFLILEAKNKPQILGRIMQNTKLLRKYKIPIVICSFASHPMQMRNLDDLKSLFINLGMHPGEIKTP